jgi:hypothetical protein
VKGYLTTYAGLFETPRTGAPVIDSIEIPLIQRDYAQGRAEASVTEIRATFLEALLDAIAGGEPLGLDFVYGKVEAGKFHPLDGQQRLTTLFLIHWYLASAADLLDAKAAWTAFSYATRPSARLFCQRLVANALPADADSPSAWITDQEWYLHVWRNDPTIQAMLVMIDAIHDTIRELHPRLDPRESWERLTRVDAPSVSFYLLPLDDMDSDDDLYIKMNSRGKPLTPFETFKAGFEHDIAFSERAAEFAHKVDGSWSDLMWPFHGGDNIVDDEFIRYIGFVTEMCELRDGRLGEGRLGGRARAVFGADNRRATDHLKFMFDAFDRWEGQGHIRSTFDGVFCTTSPGNESYDPGKTTLYGTRSTNLFEQCCHLFESTTRGTRPFSLQQSLLLYAVLLHLVGDTPDFARRVRVLRNLIAASEDEVRRDNMPGLVADVEHVVNHGDLDAVNKFSSKQVEDERIKHEFLEESPEFAEVLFRLEDSPILRGTLSCFDFDPDTFRGRAEAFEAAFLDPTHWRALTAALLATGDYQRRRPRSLAWQFGTGAPKNEAVWRDLLTSAPRSELAATRTVLSNFLDGVSASSEPIDNYLHSVIAPWLADREATKRFDWRYYLVKYPSMREGATGIYFGSDGELGYSMCMLRTKQRNGWYRDPILLETWRESDVGDLVDDPWFTGYDTTPRWLRLVRSQVGLRSVAEGFELKRPPHYKGLNAVFDGICERRDDVLLEGKRTLLAIPQTDHGDGPVDDVDRVLVGATLLKNFANADL